MKTLDHANIVIGGAGRDFVFAILEEKLNFKIRGNPDFLLIESETLGIDEVRQFGNWVINKPFLSDLKASLIVTNSITFEAQNALLKVLEEPPQGTYIFISLENLGGLLPTFLSRVRVLKSSKPETSKNIFDSKNNNLKFLKSNVSNRFSVINSFTAKDNKSAMRELLKGLEGVAYKDKFKPKDLRNILTAKIFVATRGSSPKMLLEWLSCVLQ